MVPAAYRLSLLCKAALRLTAEVHQMVREYLVIRLGVPCPHVDEMLWRSVRQWGDFYFVVTGIVHPDNRRNKPILDESAVLNTKDSDVEEQIEVQIALGDKDHCSSWGVTRPWNMLVIDSRVTRLLEDCRRHFDSRDCGHQAVVEAPWTAQQWQSFCQRWLFGPPVQTQISVHR